MTDTSRTTRRGALGLLATAATAGCLGSQPTATVAEDSWERFKTVEASIEGGDSLFSQSRHTDYIRASRRFLRCIA